MNLKLSLTQLFLAIKHTSQLSDQPTNTERTTQPDIPQQILYFTVWFSCLLSFTPAEQSRWVLTQCQIWCDCSMNHFWIIFGWCAGVWFRKQFIVLANGTVGVSCEWEIVSDMNESQDIFKSKVEWFYEIDLNDLYTSKINSRLHRYTIVFYKSLTNSGVTQDVVQPILLCNSF